jgi:tRNA pseudouridine38-40 synthase
MARREARGKGRPHGAPRSRPVGRPADGPPAERPAKPAATYKLTIEYDGSRFSGWQDQQNARTVMGELYRAIEDANLPLVELGGAGRTDAGVHALAQVAHLRLAQRYEPVAIRHALNDRLPGSLTVLEVEPAAPRFHARHDAELRSYVYQLSRRRTAFAKPYVWWIKSRLDAGRMAKALECLPGRHDFRQFAIDDPDEKSTLVEMEEVELREEGELVLLRFVASHFLWRMVRRLVGTLVRVGLGELEVEDFENLVAGRPLPREKGTPAESTAPASGLFLEKVLYAGDPALPPLRAVTPVR